MGWLWTQPVSHIRFRLKKQTKLGLRWQISPVLRITFLIFKELSMQNRSKSIGPISHKVEPCSMWMSLQVLDQCSYYYSIPRLLSCNNTWTYAHLSIRACVGLVVRGCSQGHRYFEAFVLLTNKKLVGSQWCSNSVILRLIIKMVMCTYIGGCSTHAHIQMDCSCVKWTPLQRWGLSTGKTTYSWGTSTPGLMREMEMELWFIACSGQNTVMIN